MRQFEQLDSWPLLPTVPGAGPVAALSSAQKVGVKIENLLSVTYTLCQKSHEFPYNLHKKLLCIYKVKVMASLELIQFLKKYWKNIRNSMIISTDSILF
jgi:hypothetical protein